MRSMWEDLEIYFWFHQDVVIHLYLCPAFINVMDDIPWLHDIFIERKMAQTNAINASDNNHPNRIPKLCQDYCLEPHVTKIYPTQTSLVNSSIGRAQSLMLFCPTSMLSSVRRFKKDSKNNWKGFFRASNRPLETLISSFSWGRLFYLILLQLVWWWWFKVQYWFSSCR